MHLFRHTSRVLASTALIGQLSALTITLNDTTPADIYPAYDPTGSQLSTIMRAAADYWESVILDSHNLTIDFFYDPSVSPNAQFFDATVTNGKISYGKIRFDTVVGYGNTTSSPCPVPVPVTQWYFDPTPTDHSEYGMTQVLARDMTPTDLDDMFNGPPPPLLEAAFQGCVLPTAPAAAQNRADAFTYAIHELGHGLGMTSSLPAARIELYGADGVEDIFNPDEGEDYDYDIDPIFLNGDSAAVKIDTGGGFHTECPLCLMNTGIWPNGRKLPSASDILGIATCPDPGWSQLDLPRQDFLPGGSGDWQTASNWEGNSIPDRDDDAYVRLGNAFTREEVTLSLDVRVENLTVSTVCDVRTIANKLTVDSNTTLTTEDYLNIPGLESRLFVDAGGEFESPLVDITGSILQLVGGIADIQDSVQIQNSAALTGSIAGHGTVSVVNSLVNHGQIKAEGGTLYFSTPILDNLTWDLDGPLGSGTLDATSGNLDFTRGTMDGQFEIQRSFSSTLIVGPDHYFSFHEPWTLSNGGLITLQGGIGVNPARIDGGLLTLAALSSLNVTGEARVDCPLQVGIPLLGASSVTINGTGHLEFANTLTLTNNSLVETATATLSADVHLGDGFATARSALPTTTFTPTASLHLDIEGPPSSTDWDQLSLGHSSILNGYLHLDFTALVAAQPPAPGLTWHLLPATNLSGTFTTFNHTGLPASITPVLDQRTDGLHVKLLFEGTFVDYTELFDLLPGTDLPSDNPDNDFLPSGLEFVFGTNPLVSDFTQPKPMLTMAGGSDYLSITITRGTHTTATDLVFSVQRSTNLIDWSTDNIFLQSIIPDPTNCLVTETYRSTIPRSSAPREFLRLAASPLTLVWDQAIAFDGTDLDSPTSIAINSLGQPLIAYADGGDLALATFDGNSWTSTPLDSAESVSAHLSLAVNPVSGYPAIAFYDTSDDDLHYIAFDGATWIKETVESIGNVGEYCSLAFYPSGVPAIAYYDNSADDLKFASFNGATWDLETIDSSGSVGQYCSLAFSPAGQPAISYKDSFLSYAIFNGVSWEITSNVDFFEASACYDTSLAFDPVTGNPAIAYREGLTGSRLNHVYFDGSLWQTRTVDTPGTVGKHCSLAFGPDGLPAVSYFDETNSDLKFASYDGTLWSPETIDSDPVLVLGQHTSLAFLPNGQAAISYWDLSHRDLKYATKIPDPNP